MNNSLYVVGIGPGELRYTSRAAIESIQHCDHIVGYSLYLDLINDLCQSKKLHHFPLGEEQERVRHALDLAAEGNNTALVCSGDPGIYAMASLVVETMQANKQYQKINLEIIPGISAMQMLASRCGAPLGHDFCCISLSDLLTPWSTIEKRIHAAGQGDFVIAFYNPCSKKRHWQLQAALEILCQYRDQNTPLLVGTNLGRQGEQVQKLILGQRNDMRVDMLSIVMLGNSQSQYCNELVFTPRGYETDALGRSKS